jgi:hypothetical protein
MMAAHLVPTPHREHRDQRNCSREETKRSSFHFSPSVLELDALAARVRIIDEKKPAISTNDDRGLTLRPNDAALAAANRYIADRADRASGTRFDRDGDQCGREAIRLRAVAALRAAIRSVREITARPTDMKPIGRCVRRIIGRDEYDTIAIDDRVDL